MPLTNPVRVIEISPTLGFWTVNWFVLFAVWFLVVLTTKPAEVISDPPSLVILALSVAFEALTEATELVVMEGVVERVVKELKLLYPVPDALVAYDFT